MFFWTYGTINVEGRERTLGNMGRDADIQPKFWDGWGGRNQDTRDMTGLKVVDMLPCIQASWEGIRSFDH